MLLCFLALVFYALFVLYIGVVILEKRSLVGNKYLNIDICFPNLHTKLMSMIYVKFYHQFYYFLVLETKEYKNILCIFERHLHLMSK